MTEAELAAIRGRHYSDGDLDPVWNQCVGCGKRWPCEQSRLASEVERLRGVVADAEQAKRAVLKWANSCHHVGCECDNTLADELPDDWMAVAALEEGE